MATPAIATPAFGKASLLDCEREQIHLAGSIQPCGAMLLVREPDNIIVQASANIEDFIGIRKDLLGSRLADIQGNLEDRLRPHLDDKLHEVTRGIRCQIGPRGELFDCLIHRPSGGGLIIELERTGPSVTLSGQLEPALQSIMAAATLHDLGDETVRVFKQLTGFDRVMMYRFDNEGHGEVMSEAREPDLAPLLGNRYPASDIPKIARILYERNRVRILPDVEYSPVPLLPMLSPITGEQLDMSLCFLRSSSPIHVQYLKNMGVRATLVVSLMVNGKLWGLVSCHNYAPRFTHFEHRTICELLAEAVSTRIAALESFVQAQAEFAVRRLEQQLIRTISREGDWRSALFDRPSTLLDPFKATGAALLFEGEVRSVGEVPATGALWDIGHWLDQQPRGEPIATDALGRDLPALAPLTEVASGVLAVPISTMPGEYMIWLREERVRTVTWGGNPFEPHLISDDLSTLSPRRSFAQWHQLVEGTAEPWGPAELTAARLIGETVTDVVIQFRAVRSLIAADQLSQVRRQLQQSESPLIIANDQGTILQINAAFAALLPATTQHPASLDELLLLFTGTEDVMQMLRNMVQSGRGGRAEVMLASAGSRPMLVRADPVTAPRGRPLGFVLLFTDLTDRKAAEVARKRFQQSVIAQRRPMMTRLDSQSDLMFRNILSAIVENAQLAAMEIADGVDPAQMPSMLEAIQGSVSRTAEKLGYLIWHASKKAED